MPLARIVRQQIEASLAQRSPIRLTLAPRLVGAGLETGYDTLDTVLHGGLARAGTSEIVGSRSSGRASIAAAYLAERTREGHICAWVDVAGDMSPDAGLADGIDLDRVLWVRCSGHWEQKKMGPIHPVLAGPAMYLVRGQHPSGSPRPSCSTGTPSAPNRPIDAPSGRVEQVATDRQPARRGVFALQQKVDRTMEKQPQKMEKCVDKRAGFSPAKKPWNRLEQAIKAVDLLVQAGGFGTIVLDLGGITPQFVRRIPLATWFRWRAALERTRTGLVVLSQMGCTGSSAELVLRVEAELPEPGTVMLGVPYRLEVVRRRFAEDAKTISTAGSRKPPTRESGRASAWTSQATWAQAARSANCTGVNR